MVTTEGPKALGLVGQEAEPAIASVLPIVVEIEGPAGNNQGPKILAAMTDQVSARFGKKLATRAAVEDFLKGTGLTIDQPMGNTPNAYLLTLAERGQGGATFTEILLAANKLFEKANNDRELLIYSKPNMKKVPVRQGNVPFKPADPSYSKQWHLRNNGGDGGKGGADVKAEGAWALTRGEKDIAIAILDDSVEKCHPDLAGNFKTGYFYFGKSSGYDPSPKNATQRHGTACAGVAVACSNNLGGVGMAPGCSLIGVHIWQATSAEVADAFYFADKNGASVISCSWEWKGVFDEVSVAIKDLAVTGRGGKGSVILFAAGNEDCPIAAHQAFGKLREVICVGATNWAATTTRAIPNHGPELSVVAPSNDLDDPPKALGILTTDNEDAMPRPTGLTFSGYEVGDYTADRGARTFGGTSSATPLTAGICALILSVDKDLTAGEVRAILEETADKILGDKVPAAYV